MISRAANTLRYAPDDACSDDVRLTTHPSARFGCRWGVVGHSAHQGRGHSCIQDADTPCIKDAGTPRIKDAGTPRIKKPGRIGRVADVE